MFSSPLLAAFLIAGKEAGVPRYLPYLVTGIALLVLWTICGISSSWNPLKLVEGADGRPSTSKFQFWLWTVVILSTFCGLSAARGPNYIQNNWPRNLLIVMGMSVLTTTAAKGITVGYIASNRLAKTTAESGSKSTFSAVLQDDAGFPDLSKIQMIAWTLIAVAIYLWAIVQNFNNQKWELPDIDNSLMVLMGLGQGAYLGKKLTSQDIPSLTSLSPNSGVLTSLPVDVAVTGTSFGETQGHSLVSFDGSPVIATIRAWSATQVKFSFPATQANGTAWSKGQTVLVGLLIEGQESDNKLPFSIT